jgi:YegS/Rv2252/BmrU family lipid kinase
LKKIVFIVNPNSGIFKKDNIHEVIGANLDPDFYNFNIEFTTGPGHATEISKEAAGNGYDMVVAVGGDGSINEVARGLVGTSSALGIIPAGSGNGLAHHLGIPLVRKRAIEVIKAGKEALIDTATLNDQLFVSIAGIGFDGLVARKFSKEGFRGFVAYLKVVAELYPGYKPKKYTISINNETITTKALFIAFANSDQFGFQTAIAPDAKIDDGLIDVAIVQKPQLIEIPYLAGLLYWRQINRSKHIQIYRTSEAIVKRKRNRWANLDGEPIKPGKEIHVKVYPRSLKVIIP